MSFRAKLLQAIMGIVVVTTVASLFIAQRQNSDSYKAVVDDLFRHQSSSFQQEQEIRLASAAQEVQRLADSVRLFAALEANDPEVYKIAADELRLGDYAFFRLLNAQGEVIAPPEDGRAGLPGSPNRQLIPKIAGEAPSVEKVQLGFTQIRQGDDVQVFRILASPITNFGTVVGTLILGQRIKGLNSERRDTQAADHLQSGFWLDGRLVGDDIPSAVGDSLTATLSGVQTQDLSNGQLRTAGEVYRFERFLLNAGSSYPPAYLVSVFSLAEFKAQQRLLALRIALTGLVALLLAALVARSLSRQLARPLKDLVSATREIRKGNYGVKLPTSSTREMNTLAESFNDMAAGLALKDRYHSVLNRVTDPQVAEELIAGRVRLGGELREVTVLFCDIRGYTAMTVGRDPTEVIEILNAHLTALTHIVQSHRGVISQFVGDEIFTLFGAPKSYGDDAARAVRCAWAMMREREHMNSESAEPLRIGIGIASGQMVAGCIGAETRSDYVVVGERVNLAARLCSSATAGEILIDEETQIRAGNAVSSESLQPLLLKGFSQPVPVFRVLGIQDSLS
ncbi:MAG TPA: adenylate/guanylate cyclase domain-containing protein [Burkholderiales bacterium]|nr:adenylate/guanylate cyclase domain-containing protein [Burkholderiales bacterium]